MKWYRDREFKSISILEQCGDETYPTALEIARYLDNELEDANYHTKCGMYEMIHDTLLEYGVDEETRLTIFNHFVEMGGLIKV
jgi:hypothetical protein